MMNVENIRQAAGNGDASSNSQTGDKLSSVASTPEEQNNDKGEVGNNAVATDEPGSESMPAQSQELQSNSLPTQSSEKLHCSVSEQKIESDSDVKSGKDLKSDKDSDLTSDKETAADSAKEGDVKDECLASPEPKEEWQDIFSNGDLKMKVLEAGQESSRPPEGSLVTVKVEGWLLDDTIVYDAVETFILGDGDVITAIDLCVALMHKGEVAQIITADRFAFGKIGREPDIPGSSQMNLKLKLLDVQPGPDFSTMSADERLEFGEIKRERGNQLYTRGEYSSSINTYSKAVKILEAGTGGLSGDTSVLQKVLDTRIRCYNNMAASQLKLNAYDATIRSCDLVLKSQPNNAKALYRQGKAYSAKGDFAKAIQLMKKSLEVDPEAKIVHKELALLVHKQKKERESERIMYRKMMGDMAANAATSTENSNKSSSTNSSALKWTLVVGGIFAAGLSIGVAYYRATH